MSGASANWFYVAGNDRKGPLNESQMAALASAGVINAQTNVWSEQLANWTPLIQTDLRRLIAGPGEPPPVPASAGSVPVSGFGAADGLPGTGSNAGAAQVRGFGQAIASCFSRYATFSGRANRPELWWFVLFLVLVTIVTSLLDLSMFGNAQVNPITTVFQLATLLPALAVQVRRLHDTDRSGWWILIALIPVVGGIVLLVFLCLQGTQGRNRFG